MLASAQAGSDIIHTDRDIEILTSARGKTLAGNKRHKPLTRPEK